MVQYDDVQVRQADWVGRSVTPSYDLMAWRTPSYTLGVTGSGTVQVQAYVGGRWVGIKKFEAGATSRSVPIPEMYTGRNLNSKYHQDSHITEMNQLTRLTGDSIFADTALGWRPLALLGG